MQGAKIPGFKVYTGQKLIQKQLPKIMGVAEVGTSGAWSGEFRLGHQNLLGGNGSYQRLEPVEYRIGILAGMGVKICGNATCRPVLAACFMQNDSDGRLG